MQKYDSIYKPLLFAHIGMAAFKSGSSKYIFVEAMQKYITRHIFIKIHDQTYRTHNVLLLNHVVNKGCV